MFVGMAIKLLGYFQSNGKCVQQIWWVLAIIIYQWEAT
jgi:hypothetical protein